MGFVGILGEYTHFIGNLLITYCCSGIPNKPVESIMHAPLRTAYKVLWPLTMYGWSWCTETISWLYAWEQTVYFVCIYMWPNATCGTTGQAIKANDTSSLECIRGTETWHCMPRWHMSLTCISTPVYDKGTSWVGFMAVPICLMHDLANELSLISAAPISELICP